MQEKFSLGSRLREIRGKKPQQHMAQALNVSQKTISDWEVGRSKPDATEIFSIARCFSVSTDWLLGLTNERTARHADGGAVSHDGGLAISGGVHGVDTHAPVMLGGGRMTIHNHGGVSKPTLDAVAAQVDGISKRVDSNGSAAAAIRAHFEDALNEKTHILTNKIEAVRLVVADQVLPRLPQPGAEARVAALERHAQNECKGCAALAARVDEMERMMLGILNHAMQAHGAAEYNHAAPPVAAIPAAGDGNQKPESKNDESK